MSERAVVYEELDDDAKLVAFDDWINEQDSDMNGMFEDLVYEAGKVIPFVEVSAANEGDYWIQPEADWISEDWESFYEQFTGLHNYCLNKAFLVEECYENGSFISDILEGNIYGIFDSASKEEHFDKIADTWNSEYLPTLISIVDDVQNKLSDLYDDHDQNGYVDHNNDSVIWNEAVVANALGDNTIEELISSIFEYRRDAINSSIASMDAVIKDTLFDYFEKEIASKRAYWKDGSPAEFKDLFNEIV